MPRIIADAATRRRGLSAQAQGLRKCEGVAGEMSVVIHSVPHTRQRKSWDCGLACTWMALRALQDLEDQEAVENFQHICNQQGFGTSVWTIDLAYLLAKYGVKHQFCTETLGVDPTYADQPYYESGFDSESCRINSLFGRAEESGLDVQKRFVSVQELCDHINSNGIAIVLVDSNVLNRLDQNQEDRQLVESLARLCCHRSVMEENTLPYTGHYIVVCGYDKDTDQILYKDPAKAEGVYYMHGL
jgi:hypothetical protein